MIKKEFLYLGWYLVLCVPIIVFYIKFSLKAKKEWLALTGRVKPKKLKSLGEERGHIRLESAFPVEFQKIQEPVLGNPEMHQGLTTDISKTGMSIEAFTIRGKKLDDFEPDKTKLKLTINIPAENQTVVTPATVKWVRKVEESGSDKYMIGVSYDDMPEPDLAKLMKYALFFRRRADMLAITMLTILVLVITFITTTVIYKKERLQLEKKIEAAKHEKSTLAEEKQTLLAEKENLVGNLEAVTQRYRVLAERVKGIESQYETKFAQKEEQIKLFSEQMEQVPLFTEEAVKKDEEVMPVEGEIAEEETSKEPSVALRIKDTGEEEVAPNITRNMLESEKKVFKAFRDHILAEEIQLLDRYCSEHKTSIYHAASLFAMAELRFKNRHIREMTIKAYRDVIGLYPNSKYASYASHRLDQLERNLPYVSYTLRYFQAQYNLPPLFDYRELEPYKE